jgi:hypothetical protein
MARRREIKSVLHGFLGAFVSRNSDHDGYWMFGFVIADLDEQTIDLLAGDQEEEPAAILARVARSMFRQQMEKHRLPISVLRSAQLELRRSGPFGRPAIDRYIADGWELVMTVRATTDLEKTYARETTIFVAPHEPRHERRSARWTQ